MKYDQSLAEGILHMIRKFTLVEDRKEVGTLIGATVLGAYAKNRIDAHWYIDFVYDAYEVGKEGVKDETFH